VACGDELLDEVGDDFGVGDGAELVAVGDEPLLELVVVLDDAVVDNDYVAGAVEVGVCVDFVGLAVGGPAGVSDAKGAREGGLGDGCDEVVDLASGFAYVEGAVAIDDGDACAVVAAVGEPGEPVYDDGLGFTTAKVTEDSAHVSLSRRGELP
jgi:hypothetical protein